MSVQLNLCAAHPAEESKHQLIEAEMFCFINISPVHSNADFTKPLLLKDGWPKWFYIQ